MKTRRPYLLMILDGWGYSEQTEGNAIAQAHTPTWDRLWQHCPHTLISGSGLEVGLPEGQMGNSEVGHLNMGAGRVVPQDFVRIGQAIADGAFFEQSVLINAVKAAGNHAVHIMGLLSPGGVHSHEDHLIAMIRLAALQGAKHIYLHAFLDGRDTPPKSAQASIDKIEAVFAELGVGQFASIAGRYYAMDRDQRWERVQPVYDMLTQGNAEYSADNATDALMQAYARGESDEFVLPTIIKPSIRINDGDAVIFMNFRADRARQLSRALVCEDFNRFQRVARPKLSAFVCLTEYASDIPAQVVYQPQVLSNVLGEYLANQGLNQLRIAETEKYAHVTFFFNGGREAPFTGEQRILIPSPKVATYDVQPEMSAPELTDALVSAIESLEFDVIICNYANPDMVGHTGNMKAAIKAVETIDVCLNQVVEALQAVGGELLLTADHGNVEKMVNPETHEPHTAHTNFVVPLLYVGRPAHFDKTMGALTDVAPTLLKIMGLPQPAEMTGHHLVEFDA